MTRLWTVTEAAKALRVAPRTIRTWCKDGKLGYFYTPGRHIRISGEDMAALLTIQGRR